MRPIRRLAVALWIAVFVVAGLTVATRMRGPSTQPTAPPPPRASQPAPEVLPDIRLADVAGDRRSLSEWDGSTRLINFWATWCAPCRREMPLLEALHKSRDPAVLAVIGIAIDRTDPVLTFLGETGVTYPVLVGQMDATRAAEQFGDFVALPFSVVAAPDGTVLAVHTGELHAPDLEQIAAVADALAGGTLTSEEAKARLSFGGAGPEQP